MRLKIKRKNMARFASLSALGAGAMVLTTGTADASIVHVVVDQTVGFGRSDVGSIRVSLPGNAGYGGFMLAARTHFSSYRNATIPGLYATGFRLARSVILTGRSSVLFSGSPRAVVGTRYSFFFASGTYAGRHVITSFTRQYAPYEGGGYFDFRFFGDNFTPLYGWGQLSEVIDSSGPEVTFIDYAYDTTGAFLPAGVTGAPVPEPAQTIPLGLSALVLGAAGVRRWRAAKAA